MAQTYGLNVVLGGEGLVGTTLVRKLQAMGEKAVSYDIKSGFDLREKTLPDFPADTYVWFLAWDVGGSKYIFDGNEQLGILKSNLQLCEMVFGALEKQKLPFTFVSTQLMTQMSAYGATKRLGEIWTELLGRGLLVRLWNVYGAEELSKKSHVIPDLVAQGKSRTIRLLTTGAERRQFIHAEDCAEALIHQRRTGQKLAEITNGRWSSILEVAQIIAKRYDAAVVPGTKEGLPGNNEPKQPLEGWTPRIDLETGLNMVIRHMEEHGWV